MRAPAEKTSSNSACPQLHGANLDSLVIRNPPGNKSMFLHRHGGRIVEHLENIETSLEYNFFLRLVGSIKRVPVAMFFLSGSLTYSVED